MRYGRTWFSLLIICGFVGCFGGDSAKAKRPARTQVSGTVTAKGAPVEGATVTFHPTVKGPAAFGVTDSSGKFVLGTFEQKDGAVPGEYLVTVSKEYVVEPGSQPLPGDPGYNPEAKAPAPVSMLPAKYKDLSKSGLKATVGETAVSNLEFKVD